MTILETTMDLAQRASSIAHSPYRHNIRGLLEEMHRASTTLSHLIQDARERVELYDALDALYAEQAPKSKEQGDPT